MENQVFPWKKSGPAVEKYGQAVKNCQVITTYPILNTTYPI